MKFITRNKVVDKKMAVTGDIIYDKLHVNNEEYTLNNIPGQNTIHVVSFVPL